MGLNQPTCRPVIAGDQTAGLAAGIADPLTASRHAPLVQQAAGIFAAINSAGPIVLRDAAGPGRTDQPGLVTLARGARPGIRRPDAGSAGPVQLTYSDPASAAALGGLIACAARPGTPVVADPETLAIVALAERLAASDIPVLINGPTGTGKEVLSRFIHARSARAAKPFIAVNCAAMPEAMLEALLFGHKKGAFTGATAESEGFFRAADGGTLLLDEIAEMPLGLQAKLLRVLQEGEVVPIGATSPIPIDVRIIACVNRDLPQEVAENRFRADLFYRLNVFPLALPALRERAEDIVPLSFALLLRHTPAGRDVPWISAAALAMLKLHGWPGNVRELENVIRRALLLAGDAPQIEAVHIVFDQTARLVQPEAAALVTVGDAPERLSNIVQLSEARAIMDTLADCNGNRIAAARRLGISERTLRYRLASLREAGLMNAGARA